MSLKDIKFTVNNRDFYIRQWPASKAFLYKMKIVKLLGRSLADMATAYKDKDLVNNKEQVIAVFSDAVQKLFESASEEEVLKLMIEVIEQAAMDGQRLTNRFDEAFSGEYMMDAYKVFFKIIMENFSDFFKGFEKGNPEAL